MQLSCMSHVAILSFVCLFVVFVVYLALPDVLAERAEGLHAGMATPAPGLEDAHEDGLNGLRLEDLYFHAVEQATVMHQLLPITSY